MRHYRHFAAVSVLALALAACGGPAEEESTGASEAVTEVDAGMAAEEVVGADGTAEDAAAEDAAAEEAAAEEPAATPTPTPTPAATQAAAMAQPASFTQCAICHSVERGQNGIGPSLAGVVGRRSGSVAGYSYSPAMAAAGLTWNEATLSRYLGDPSGVVPGTTMALPGIPAADRAAIIAYLKTK